MALKPNDRRLTITARAVFAAISVVVAVTSALSFPEASIDEATSWGTPGAWSQVFFALAMYTFPVVGYVILGRQPRNAVAWILMLIGVVWSLTGISDLYVAYGLSPEPPSPPSADVVLAFTEWLWIPAIGLIGTFLILLFPDGRLPSERWRPFARGVVAVMFFAGVAQIFMPGRMVDSGYPEVVNPVGIEALRPLLTVFSFSLALLPLSMIVSAVALIRRYRRSHGQARLQLKWLAASAGAVAGIFVAAMALTLPASAGQAESPRWAQVIQMASLLSFALIPISIGIAILKYRLYEIDRIINRTLVYGAITSILVGIYLGAVFVFQRALSPLTSDSDVAIAASTLAVAGLFQPIRAQVQDFVDRRFYRRKFDAQLALEDFSSRLRDEVDISNVTAQLTGVVAETMQPTHVSLWLRPTAEQN